MTPYKIKDLYERYKEYGPTGPDLGDISYPYLNFKAFKLFMNLILAPAGIKINNPYNLTIEDLEPIFMTFVKNNTENGDSPTCLLNVLKSQLSNNN